ncbi:unnamed protein product [Rotaria sp. Silwood1]|nr:unnamed protein product [Rotaria sp. Silwood1]CAF4832136.1 unnamed protein product [Rotaria sp. Silwood1]
MSWIIEKSDNASSAINIQGNSVTCHKEGDYGSPIHVLWKDPAEKSGLYYWQIEFSQLDEHGVASVGLTTQDHFKGGYRLKAMEYNGNLTNGIYALVGAFGSVIKQGDTIDILLNLTDSEMKVHLFHNGQPLGLAFHVQAPFPKPLFPVISFYGDGKAAINRSEKIPKMLDRRQEQFKGMDGHWKLVDHPQYSECIGYHFRLFKPVRADSNTYCLWTSIVNDISCDLVHDPFTNKWTNKGIQTTLMDGDDELLRKEEVMLNLLDEITNVGLQGQHLVMMLNGNQVKFERYTQDPSIAYTKNVFTEEY